MFCFLLLFLVIVLCADVLRVLFVCCCCCLSLYFYMVCVVLLLMCLACLILLLIVFLLFCMFCSGRGGVCLCFSMCLRLLLFVVVVLSCVVLSCVYVLCLFCVHRLFDVFVFFCWFVLRVLGVMCDCFCLFSVVFFVLIVYVPCWFVSVVKCCFLW